MVKRKTDSQDKRGLKRLKSALVVIVCTFIIGVIVAAIGVMVLFSGGRVNTSIVRKEWQNSPLANSSYFKATEIEEEAENDRIFLSIDGIEPEVKYYCQSTGGGLSRNCDVSVGGDWNRSGSSGLSDYLWFIHEEEINAILQKYDGKLDKWTNVQIKVYDEQAAAQFIGELLDIPDMKKLYLAYQEGAERSNETDARVYFGEYWLDFQNKSPSQGARSSLFAWAKEQGL